MNLACYFVKKPSPPPPETGIFSLFGKGRVLSVLLVAGSLLFAGCDFVNKFLGTEDDSDSGPKEGAEESPWKGVPVPTAGSLPSIKAKFGIQLDGAEGVTAAFQELSAFIKKGGLGVNWNVIRLGDYIDLEGGLTVDPYGTGSAANSDEKKGKISLNDQNDPDKSMRKLIVVGINSFRSNGTYNKTENNGVDHVVFQFQNIPGIHQMNPTNDNTGGYAKSEMRKYLVPVYQEDGSKVEGSGSFLDGLFKAGVPVDVLWGPTRYLSTKGFQNEAEDITTLDDLLWLPTRFEMTGESKPEEADMDFPSSSSPNPFIAGTGMRAETAENQVRLEYYPKGAEGDSNRAKSTIVTDPNLKNRYWLSSVHPSDYSIGFANVQSTGNAGNASSISVFGVAPAFCVR